MTKKIALLFLLIALTIGLAVPVSARDPRIVDNADLFTGEELSTLASRAALLSDTYQIDTVILTVDALDDQDIESYADDYYDHHDYGYGDENSGVLFVLAMETREWAISTTGDGIYALTDYGIESVFSEMAGDLSQGRYYDAFLTYLEELETYYQAFASGSPIDGVTTPYDGPGTYEPGTAEDIVHYEKPMTAGYILSRLAISLVVGSAIGGIVLLIMRRGMRTARAQSGADPYMDASSFRMLNQQNILLGSHVSRSERVQNDSGGGGGGGGSSVHTSSSGTSHGGGHGTF